MKIHSLKIGPQYLEDIRKGLKPWEIRFNDRDFEVGDILKLKEYVDGEYTKVWEFFKVTYVFDNPEYVKEGFVILSIVPISKSELSEYLKANTEKKEQYHGLK